MGFTWASYYGFARVSETGPEVKNWAVTDTNPELGALLFKRFEQHHHNAATPMSYPGYNILNPATPATPLIVQSTSGGYLAAGTDVGVRMSFVDQYGLETSACPELFVSMPADVVRPNSPVITGATTTPVPNALPGGTFLYAVTKRRNTGESLISDVAVVDVPFDGTGNTSYTVPLAFDPIGTYTDGTDSLMIYRTTGFDSSFVLLKVLKATPDGAVSAYIDNGVVTDFTHQPPQVSEFGKQNQININWGNINLPGTAYRFRVYITQQTGVWGNYHLFQDLLVTDPATPFPTNVSYLGNEVLTAGYPLEFTQIPFGAALIDLGTEAVGGPIYTTAGNARGYPTYNFVFPDQTHSTPLFGNAYVDSSVGQLKVVLSTPGGTGVYTTLAGVGSGYAHPIVESGGHTASHIQAAPAVGGPTQDQLNKIFSTPVGTVPERYRIQATNIYKVTATPTDLYNSTQTTWQYLSDMDTLPQWPSGISPDFSGQWFEIDFRTGLQFTTGVTSIALEINGVQIPETLTPYGGVQSAGAVSRASLTANQAIGIGYSYASFDTETYDPNNIFNAGTGIFTVTSAGYYEINAGAAIQYEQNPQLFLAAVSTNAGLPVLQVSTYRGLVNGDIVSESFSDIVHLNVGDTIQLIVYNGNTNSSTLMGGGQTYMSVAQLPVTGSGTTYTGATFTYATPLTRSNNRFRVQWQINTPGYALSYGGNIISQPPRRALVVKELF